jgi:TctA family transporter
MEVAFRQSLMISHGDFSTFTDRPISLAFLLATALFLNIPIFRLGLKRLGKGGSSKGPAPIN